MAILLNKILFLNHQITTIKMKTNTEILAERMEQLNAIQGPRVGDYLKLPYGIYTRFTHEHHDHIQTGGGSDSYYLGNGYLSYSGGLDRGIDKDQIVATEETRDGAVWFFDKDISGAGRGVHYVVELRVFEPIEGADLSGCPQIAKYEKQLIKDKAEKITRINGNGHAYTLPIPELVILSELSDFTVTHLEKDLGLSFERCGGGYKCQPMFNHQIVALLTKYSLATEFHCNSTHENTLFLKFVDFKKLK